MTQYTRCPHCDTAFVVTEEQLTIANGKVRCGNCKAIFNAREPEPELTEEPSAQEEPSAYEEPSAQEEPPAESIEPQEHKITDSTESSYPKYLPVEDDAEIASDEYEIEQDSNEDGLHYAVEFTPEEQVVVTDEVSIDQPSDEDESHEDETNQIEGYEVDVLEEEVHEDDSHEDDAREDDSHEDDAHVDDSHVDDAHVDDAHEDGAREEVTDQEKRLNIPELMETGQEVEQHFDDSEQIRATAKADTDVDSLDDESEHEELAPTTEPVGEDVHLDEDSDKIQVALESENDYQESHEANYQGPLSEEEQFASSLDRLDLRESDPEARAKVVDAAVAGNKTSGVWLKQLGWLFGSLFILFAILAVIFWFKRFELAADPQWRPLVDSICEYVDCGIPTQRDVSKIELMSREVTVQDEAVKVNMILLNRASFPQPYPRIEIDFFDLDGNRLATRVELPTEYLRKDMQNKAMTPGVPVHIEFSVDINTDEVVGYVFRLL